MNKMKLAFTIKIIIISLFFLSFPLRQNQIVSAKQLSTNTIIEDSIIMSTDIVTIHKKHNGKRQHRRWDNQKTQMGRPTLD